MKKVMYFMGCALFVAAMAVACGSKDENKDEKNAQQTEQKADEQKAPEQNEPVQAVAQEEEKSDIEKVTEGINDTKEAVEAGKELVNTLKK